MDKRKNVAEKIIRYILRTLLCIVTLVVVLLIVVLSAVFIISKGPSSTVREMMVTALVETGQMDFCAHFFLTNDEINEIVEKNQMIVPEGETDTSLIVIKGDGDDDDGGSSSGTTEIDEEKGIEYNEQGVWLYKFKGKTYDATMLIVKDPTRVSVAGLETYGDGVVGKSTEQMAIDANALAAINGGGYREMSDYKTGGFPEGRDEGGVVIIDGELRYGELTNSYEIIGLDKSGILHIDRMTAQEALDMGIVSAVNWGPILVKNGEPCVIDSESVNPGFHPRTAIGQRADGSIILLVIDGRQAQSMGASYDDLIEIMMEYGAVNAANLDGGMSSYMVYDGEVITSPYMLYFNGRRTVSTSFIVSRLEDSTSN